MGGYLSILMTVKVFMVILTERKFILEESMLAFQELDSLYLPLLLEGFKL